MNIGEISKPNADRSQINKKLKVAESEPVVATEAISDLVELSKESQQRYREELKKGEAKSGKEADGVIDSENQQEGSKSIDVTA